MSTRNDDPKHASRPFDKERDGFVMGEGSGVLVLEELEHAKARGARIYCEFAGYGNTADASHISKPDDAGQVRAMQAALAEARMNSGQIDYVNAHGTATSIGDIVETAALKQVFGVDARRVPISSTKALHGHLMGATGAVELVATIAAIGAGAIPPTAHLDARDPACDLDYVPNEARPAAMTAAMSNSFAFGGMNAVLVVRRFIH